MKKAQGLSLNFVIVGIIALVVLVVIILIFTGGLTPVDKDSEELLYNQHMATCEREFQGTLKLECGDKENQVLRLGSVTYQNERYVCCVEADDKEVDSGGSEGSVQTQSA
jgi:uncharacterized membrane protein YqiK